MFNRIALMWTWALIFIGLLRFPVIKSTSNYHGLYMLVVALLFVSQVIFVVVMTWKQYHRLRDQHGAFRQSGYELEQQVLRETSEGRSSFYGYGAR